MADSQSLLVVNGGSSSIKLALYDVANLVHPIATWELEKIGMAGTVLKTDGAQLGTYQVEVAATSYQNAADIILSAALHSTHSEIVAIGHRVVHGGTEFSGPVQIDEDVLRSLRGLEDLDPEHMPGILVAMSKCTELFPGVPQIASFDTAFYSELPRVAQLTSLPRKFEQAGLRRYGFHGLSYKYLLDTFSEVCGKEAAHGKVIFAHLGSGVSLTATHNGKPIDTTMGLTPASGVPMSTRAGDVDPGVFWFLHRKTRLDAHVIDTILNKQSGLLGVSETSADMYELLQKEESDQRAAEAVELFCYQVKKAIGSLAAVLGGVDSIVIAGGMGENAPKIRSRILSGLEFMGIKLDDARNERGERYIAAEESDVGIHVFHTREDTVIAQQTMTVLRHIKEQN